ncbi:AraC family transcriptional regulator [Roseobacter litoralis]|uniref:AraC family transcriptional regulator n=1 Tax=Roseobacter litoralis TaxID=42443 RepID=UPI00249085A2|nr:AraC family transcriptional regulator [Roseobacter litoralis]
MQPNPPPKQLVPVFWLRHLVDHLGPGTPHVSSVLRDLGLDRLDLTDPELKIDQRKEAEFLDAVSRRSNQPFLGAQSGIRLDVRKTSLLSYLLFNSQNLDHALQNLVRFLPLMRPSSKVSMTREADKVSVHFANRIKGIAMNAQHVEFCAAMLINSMRRASESAICPITVTFAHRRSADAGILNDLFSCPVSFDGAVTTVVLRSSDVGRPVMHRDPNLYREMFSYGRILLRDTAPASLSVEELVINYVADHLTRTPPGIEETADALGLSRRTLARRLARNGTSYSMLRDNLRISAARQMLAETDTPLAEVTYLLRYSDQSAFGAAFKRATGQTPNQYRLSYRVVD